VAQSVFAPERTAAAAAGKIFAQSEEPATVEGGFGHLLDRQQLESGQFRENDLTSFVGCSGYRFKRKRLVPSIIVRLACPFSVEKPSNPDLPTLHARQKKI